VARKRKQHQLAARLAALHEAGLFEKLSLAEAEQADGSEDQEDVLAVAVDRHVSERSYPYTYRAIQEVPKALKLGKVLRVIGLGTLSLESKDGTIAFKPRTHHQWAGVLDRALAEIGDQRRFIAIKVIDWEEPLFVLATPAQATLLREVDLEDPNVDDADPETVASDAALGEIADSLARKLPSAITPRVAGSAIELVAKPAEVGALVDALYTAHFADLRLSAHSQRRYGGKA
jgi:hypothetical protein